MGAGACAPLGLSQGVEGPTRGALLPEGTHPAQGRMTTPGDPLRARMGRPGWQLVVFAAAGPLEPSLQSVSVVGRICSVARVLSVVSRARIRGWVLAEGVGRGI